MQLRSWPLARIVCIGMLIAVSTEISPAHAQAQAQAGSAAGSATKLTTRTTDDKTATVGIPDGWTLVNGANGFVFVTGPQDQRVNLGAILIGKDGPAAAGAPGGEVAFTLPFSTSLKDKFIAALQAGAARQGKPKRAITIASEAPTKLPMCARYVGSWTSGGETPRSFEGILCSLRPDWLGFYKNILFLLQVPTSRAAEDRPVVEQIAHSYRVTPEMFRKMVATYTPLPPAPATGPAPMMPGLAPYQDPTNSDCFDYNIIRESPPWEVPMRCGGINPYQ